MITLNVFLLKPNSVERKNSWDNKDNTADLQVAEFKLYNTLPKKDTIFKQNCENTCFDKSGAVASKYLQKLLYRLYLMRCYIVNSDKPFIMK